MSDIVQPNGYSSSSQHSLDTNSGQRQQSLTKSWHGIQSFCRILVFFIFLSLMPHQGFAERTGLVERTHTGKVCGSIDVRNHVNNFNQIRNCSIIDGSLSILLIDYANVEEYEVLSFPLLVEITDYLLLFRVYGLKTLSHIFPNLTVIRGLRLFFNYALVVYEMPDYEDIGLPGLVSIVRGSVRIEKNSQLCYVDTIDWTRIANVEREDNFIVENKMIDECVNVCPKTEDNRKNLCHEQNIVDAETGISHLQPLCWNSRKCQKVCPSECLSKGCFETRLHTSPKLTCCHDQCLGGCYGRGDTRCVACKNVFYDGRCLTRCPPHTYLYRKHRCLTADQCKGLTTEEYSEKWKVVNDSETNMKQCLSECPSRYREAKNDPHRCERCVGPCPKVCSGVLTIDSVEAAQNLKGCTIIKGNLEIQIRGGSDFMNELEKTMGNIEVVDGYIRFRNSHIINLSFLKKLRLIRGKSRFMDRYALFVLDNQNLEDIWDFNTHPNLTIVRGRAAFHFNRKLCLNKIYHLLDAVGVRNQTDENDVSSTTNGDLVACDITQLHVEIVSVQTYFTVIRWNNFKPADARQLLNYVINYIEAPEQNITIFNARDACGNDQWHTIDVLPDDDPKAAFVAAIMYHLKPFTQYAVYVQTYTISTAKQGALSPIHYFTTLAGVPSSPRNLKVNTVNPVELVITWDPPSEPRGNVTHYIVYYKPLPLDQEKFDQRDYCVDKPRPFSSKKNEKKEKNTPDVEKKPENTPNSTASGDCCASCLRPSDTKKIEEEERQQQILFENYLHNNVYTKQTDEDINNMPMMSDFGGSRRSKRSSNIASKSSNMFNSIAYGNDSFVSNWNTTHPIVNITLHGNETSPPESKETNVPDYASVVTYSLEAVLVNLKHFTEYSIEVIACQGSQEDIHNRVCSNRAITHARTQSKFGADDLDPRNITVMNDTKNSPKIFWQDPADPNGIIVTYEVELSNVVENYKPDSFCITHQEYRQIGGYQIKAVGAGNWSIRIRATSLASNGSWTPYIYFTAVSQDNAKPVNVTLIAVISVCAGLLVVAVASMTIWFFAKKRFSSGIPDGVMIASVNPDYFSPDEIYVADDWEMARDKIELLHELGQGSFGMVYEGIAKDTVSGRDEIKVAVKTVNENASIRDRIEFLNEASIMKAFNTNHVVKLLGVVSKGQPTLVVMELMAKGDLKCFLRQHRPDEEGNEGQLPPTLKEILQMAGEIADGMAYLAAKKFVHRDLAARNCMVSENMVVKIGDFGMTRDIYETDYYRKGGRGLLPVRWMAPESLKDGVFTSQCDVWSYGIVLWEMATLAAQPYQGLANEQVLKWVLEGGIMDKPEGCPDKLYNLMLLCWRHSPRHRPTFCDIIEILSPDLNDLFRETSFYFSEENQERTGHSKHSLEGGAGNDSLHKEYPEDLLDMDDSRTPLTASPKRLQFNADINSRQDPDKEEMHFEDEFDQLEALSQASSSLSYHSQQRSPMASRPCLHDQPCECVELMGTYSKVKPEARDSAERWSPERFRLAHNDDSRDYEVAGHPRGGGNDGSKESSKSSDSSQSGGRNGMMNGHIPHYVPQC